MHSTSRNPKERPPANGASAAPAGVRLTCGLAEGGREKTEPPDRRQNTASLFNPRQIHLSQRRICLNHPSHPSTYLRAQAEAVAAELLEGGLHPETGKRNLTETRRWVESGWRSVAGLLSKEGHGDIAEDVRRFVEMMPPANTERELVAQAILQRARESRKIDRAITR